MSSVTQNQYEPIGASGGKKLGWKRKSRGRMNWQEGPGSPFGQDLAQALVSNRPREMIVE